MRYKTKAEWAAAKAAALETSLAELHREAHGGSYSPRRHAQRARLRCEIIAEAERLRSLARRFAANGQ